MPFPISIHYLHIWEELSNTNFKLAESREFKNESASQSFTMSPSRWIRETDAIGFISKRGKYDGALFGMTSKEWKDKNPTLNGNMRDYANILQLVILSNLENLNSEMISQGIEQKTRLERLNLIAKKQYDILQDNNSIKKIEMLDNNIKQLE